MIPELKKNTEQKMQTKAITAARMAIGELRKL